MSRRKNRLRSSVGCPFCEYVARLQDFGGKTLPYLSLVSHIMDRHTGYIRTRPTWKIELQTAMRLNTLGGLWGGAKVLTTLHCPCGESFDTTTALAEHWKESGSVLAHFGAAALIHGVQPPNLLAKRGQRTMLTGSKAFIIDETDKPVRLPSRIKP